jgi:mannose-1-phosphate guanylyltransferase
MSVRGREGAFHVILLAGGSGTRFWPLSRGGRPKQLLALLGRRPLLVQAWRRARKLAPARRIWVVAPAKLVREVRRLLPGLLHENLVVEPAPRDTAPAVGLGCATIARTDPSAVAVVLPTDHVILDEAEFARSVRAAARAARGGSLVCLGVRPDRPATGFGYLKCSSRPIRGRSVAVDRFVEKPAASRARRFLRSGSYLWNAGMFVWRVQSFLDEMDRTAPRIGRAVRKTVDGDGRAWAGASKLSVDYAVMENARDVRVVPLDAGWDDVGSWDAVVRLRGEADSHDSSRVLVDSPGSAVFGSKRLVALVDVPGVAVIDTPDALLVVSRASSEKVRAVVDELRRRGRKDLL